MLLNQIAAALATGNRAMVLRGEADVLPKGLPAEVRDRLLLLSSLAECSYPLQMALIDPALAIPLRLDLAGRDGAVISVIETTATEPVQIWRLVAERALCINTTAAGGNASLMTLGL